MSRQGTGSNRPASRYLAPEILGGTRVTTGYERVLSALSGGQYVLPGRNAKLDAYGNLSQAQLSEIVAAIPAIVARAAPIVAKRGKQRTASMANAMQSPYFIGRDGSTGLPRGIFKLIGAGHVQEVLAFTKTRPHYSVRLPLQSIVMRSVNLHWERLTGEAVQRAIDTARPK